MHTDGDATAGDGKGGDAGAAEPPPPPGTARERLLAHLLDALSAEPVQLCWLDPDFVHWPLNDARLLEALRRWGAPQRRLRLLALDFEPLRQAHPRFLRWRQLHEHLVVARQLPEEARRELGQGAMPLALALGSGPAVWQLWDWRRGPERLSLDPANHRARQQWFDAISQRSAESFASTTLGL